MPEETRNANATGGAAVNDDPRAVRANEAGAATADAGAAGEETAAAPARPAGEEMIGASEDAGGGLAGSSPAGEDSDDWARRMAEDLEQDLEQPGSEPPPAPPPAREPGIQPVQFGQLADAGQRRQGSIDLLLDVKLPISVELGRTEMLVKEILEFGPGTVIELTKLAGEPVDVFINGRMVAQGEVVVVEGHFGVRITNLLSPRDRVRSLA